MLLICTLRNSSIVMCNKTNIPIESLSGDGVSHSYPGPSMKCWSHALGLAMVTEFYAVVTTPV